MITDADGLCLEHDLVDLSPLFSTWTRVSQTTAHTVFIISSFLTTAAGCLTQRQLGQVLVLNQIALTQLEPSAENIGPPDSRSSPEIINEQ